jgi:2-polyprenyl-3-methyl-5-hydroxy-6-metoxy-1,4-benzoquinol methylase
MTTTSPNADFPEHATENRRIWDANASWWDDRIGGGNDFQDLLIEPPTEGLLELRPGDRVLDVACGAGRFTRRMAALGADVVAFDSSTAFIARARERTPADARIEYQVLDAANADQMQALGAGTFDKAVCTMALMDMPEISPLFHALAQLLRPGAAFVFSVLHPAFHSSTMQRFAEMHDDDAGRNVVRTGIKVSSYLSPSARRTEGILGQPEPQFVFHRPLSLLLQPGFDAGFTVDGMAEPRLPRDDTQPDRAKAGLSWADMTDIPPILVVRMKLISPID